MGYEEFEDGDITAIRNDIAVEVDWQDNQFDMTIEQAMRFRDWLNRVLPPSESESDG